MSVQRFILTDSYRTNAQLDSLLHYSDKNIGMSELVNYLTGMIMGIYPAQFKVANDMAYATATLTVSAGGSSNNETMTIANVTFTAKTSGATGNQFNISATAATQASNMASAFNASSDLAGVVSASANGAVVTLTSLVPGVIGNGIDLTESLTNVAKTAFSGGSDGTRYTLDFS